MHVVAATYGNYQEGIIRDLSKYRFNGETYQRNCLYILVAVHIIRWLQKYSNMH